MNPSLDLLGFGAGNEFCLQRQITSKVRIPSGPSRKLLQQRKTLEFEVSLRENVSVKPCQALLRQLDIGLPELRALVVIALVNIGSSNMSMELLEGKLL